MEELQLALENKQALMERILGESLESINSKKYNNSSFVNQKTHGKFNKKCLLWQSNFINL